MADVTVATIDTGQGRNSQFSMGGQGLFCKTDQILYALFLQVTDDPAVTKSTDGGQTWTYIGIIIGAVGGGGGDHEGMTGWADWTTLNYSANAYIHVWSLQVSVSMNVWWGYIDTASDTIGTPVQVFSGGTTGATPTLSGCRAQGGNLYIRATKPTATTINIFYRSTDNGANWTSRTIATDDAIGDQYRLLPSNNADTNDIWCVRFDASANTFDFDRYDDSANTWGTTAFGASIFAPGSASVGSTNVPGYDAKIRFSDYHVIVIGINSLDSATGDLLTWDITPNGTGVPTVTAKTDVITNKDDFTCIALFIDQLSSDIYVSYAGKDDGSQTIGTTVSMNYKKSTNGMTSWSTEAPYSAGTGLYGSNYSCVMGATSGRFIPMFLDHTALNNLVNYDNSIAIGATAATVVPRPVLVNQSVRRAAFV